MRKKYGRDLIQAYQQAAHVFSVGRAEAARRVPAQIEQYHLTCLKMRSPNEVVADYLALP